VLANTELRRIYYILLIKCCWRLISWQFWRNNANHHNEKSIFTTVSGAMLKSSGKNVDDCLLITVHSGARLKRTCSTTLPPAGITQWAVTRPQITTNDWRLTCLKTLAINMAVGRVSVGRLSAHSRASVSSGHEQNRRFSCAKWLSRYDLENNHDFDLGLKNCYSTIPYCLMTFSTLLCNKYIFVCLAILHVEKICVFLYTAVYACE